MKSSSAVELWVGIFVVLGAGALLILSLSISNLTSLFEDDDYNVTANFSNIGGLKVKAPVTMSGVLVGRVVDINYDQDRYKAKVTFRVHPRYNKIPEDTSVNIYTAGLLGEQYLALQPGAEDTYWQENSQAMLTQDALVLEELVGKFLYSFAAGSRTGTVRQP